MYVHYLFLSRVSNDVIKTFSLFQIHQTTIPSMIPQNSQFFPLTVDNSRDQHGPCTKADENQFFLDYLYQRDCRDDASFTDDMAPFHESVDSSDFALQEKLDVLVLPTLCQRNRQVSFSTVQVREYKLILGDWQSSKPYPMSLGWSHGPTQNFNVDDTIPKEAKHFRRRSMIREARGIDTLSFSGGRLTPLSTAERKFRLVAMGCSIPQFPELDRRRRAQKILDEVLKGKVSLHRGEAAMRKYYVRHLL